MMAFYVENEWKQRKYLQRQLCNIYHGYIKKNELDLYEPEWKYF